MLTSSVRYGFEVDRQSGRHIVSLPYHRAAVVCPFRVSSSSVSDITRVGRVVFCIRRELVGKTHNMFAAILTKCVWLLFRITRECLKKK